MIWQLREQLMDEIPDFGVHLGYNGKVLQSYSSRQVMKCKGRTLDSDADWAGMDIAQYRQQSRQALEQDQILVRLIMSSKFLCKVNRRNPLYNGIQGADRFT